MCQNWAYGRRVVSSLTNEILDVRSSASLSAGMGVAVCRVLVMRSDTGQ